MPKLKQKARNKLEASKIIRVGERGASIFKSGLQPSFQNREKNLRLKTTSGNSSAVETKIPNIFLNFIFSLLRFREWAKLA